MNMRRIRLAYGIALTFSLVAGQAAAQSLERFAAADAMTRQRMLSELVALRAPATTEDVITLARAGMHDPTPEVRIAALSAVAARAMAARWAGTSGPVPSAQQNPSSGQSATIPSDRRDDQRKLRETLFGDCLQLARTDRDEKVRESALLALGNLERPLSPTEPWREQFIEQLVELFRRDSDPRIRGEIVKSFRLSTNDSGAVRAVLRDALLDRYASVRNEALASITPSGRRSKLSFGDARVALGHALESPDPDLRIAAIQALRAFGPAASEFIPVLQRLRQNDRDAGVRSFAELSLDAIRMR
jgi:hypothetical protein